MTMTINGIVSVVTSRIGGSIKAWIEVSAGFIDITKGDHADLHSEDRRAAASEQGRFEKQRRDPWLSLSKGKPLESLSKEPHKAAGL